ncbi:DNA-3-methyladenine glycosylase 1 [Paraburkholderia ribeironis]|uniref:DNA-3-methyladenine glycosylase 1 n=1 Tax=Paraburkholderia ribeironis TaxID=1247936 RepID=A0A1N7RW20_9BURK|nr:DNA-3-methyladenine glycosylase I [Paraburkholderia ribeironis]SIT39291.1 DNA-3-methyladenine glycosylase 1 [Paraburkholderia ribeironis]
MDLFVAPDGRPRCGWAGTAPEFLAYHDNEWGYPVADDIRLFEKISLEGFQSGLSWRTILVKRENFRDAFDGFNFHVISGYDQRDVNRLLMNAGIIRHKGKIEAVINNARKAVELQAESGSLANFFWRYEPAPDECDAPQSASTSPASIALSKELKRRGWKFVGPTTMFAFMQAMGLINDHVPGCVIRSAAAEARRIRSGLKTRSE